MTRETSINKIGKDIDGEIINRLNQHLKTMQDYNQMIVSISEIEELILHWKGKNVDKSTFRKFEEKTEFRTWQRVRLDKLEKPRESYRSGNIYTHRLWITLHDRPTVSVDTKGRAKSLVLEALQKTKLRLQEEVKEQNKKAEILSRVPKTGAIIAHQMQQVKDAITAIYGTEDLTQDIFNIALDKSKFL